MSAETDVVVIGAGASGLAAGTRLRRAGIPFRILEAASVPGGRAATDTTTLGVPFDLGCHWLHDARANPFTALAARLGFRVGATNSGPRRLHLGSRFATPEEKAQADAEVDQVFAAVIAAGRAGRDVAASEVAGPPGRFGPLARHWLELMSAAGPDSISCADFAFYHDTDDNWPVLDGYGALVLAAAGALPVTLDCPVSRIDRSGARLKIDSAQGSLSCHKVIVTVSTAVIASGRLAFAPALPPDMAEAFAALPLGFAEKVALAFDEDVFGVPERTALDAIDLDQPARAGASALLKPGGAPAALVHVAGPEAQALAADGEGALVAFALDVLGAAFGAGLKTKVKRSLVTRWAAMPYIGGAYSCALPGRAGLRARLHEPLDGRIFFAGEALGREAFSTCHGAHLSGLAAADAALAALNCAR
ncbi:flavin monoamine oxidase family protein [Xanthobacter autotrophicus]|uniref:flavin monoamine oxidase family protein n=1 Tax=Xanthobacter autotrophicus TaxID=280 RepID=UPI0024A7964E|nr:FAD-dependent oxidoreductase [Xanthobacter autotrophicus]MDI4658715.1 FAD-dependent oxidoreductase [Xanthobacter autotrophicus]